MRFQPNKLDLQLFQLALQEDLSDTHQDVTTHYLYAEGSSLKKNWTTRIISKHDQPMIVCGLSLIAHLFTALGDKDFHLETTYEDGDCINSGETLVTLSASACTLLMLERTILNFLQRLSGIATLTARYVKAVQSTGMRILDTRKTAPGFRHLEKFAVACGGGVNHRFGLYDAVMIKDTHVDMLGGGMAQALQELPLELTLKMPVIVEVRNLEELEIALSYQNKITRILLDNMPIETLAACVDLCKGRVSTEASGNIHLGNVLEIAQTGVDFASIGKLTHSALPVDLSMKAATLSSRA